MTTKEAVETIKLAIAEVEWEYPMSYSVAFEKAIDALERLESIRSIVSTKTYLQEDVLRYKMVCEILERGEKG